MSDPIRWSDGAAPPGVHEVLAAARKPRPMSPAERAEARSRAAQVARLPVRTPLPWWLRPLLVTGVAVTALLLAVAWNRGRNEPVPVAHTLRRSVPPPVAPPVTPEPPAVAPAVPAHVAAATPPAAGQGNARVHRAPAPAGVPGTTAPVEAATLPGPCNYDPQEERLMDEARRLLATQPAEVLPRVEARTSGFPRGCLASEGEYLAVQALQRLGRPAEARQRAAVLVGRYPGTPYAARVRSILSPSP